MKEGKYLDSLVSEYKSLLRESPSKNNQDNLFSIIPGQPGQAYGSAASDAMRNKRPSRADRP